MSVHSWPVALNLKIADLIGSVMFRVDRRHRNRAVGNLRRSFPAMSEQQLHRLADQSMQHMCRLAVETVSTTRLIHIHTFAQYVEFVSFSQTLDLMLRRNQGLIMLTGHYGNWEILGYVLATLGFPPPASPGRWTIRTSATGSWASASEPVSGSSHKRAPTTEVTEVLEQGHRRLHRRPERRQQGALRRLLRPQGQHVQVDRAAGDAVRGAGGHRITPRRSNDRFRFQIGVQDIIYPEDWKAQDDPLRYITQRYTKAIEDFVRQDPANTSGSTDDGKRGRRGGAEAYD